LQGLYGAFGSVSLGQILRLNHMILLHPTVSATTDS